MKMSSLMKRGIGGLVMILVLVASLPAMAEKPTWAGGGGSNGKSGKKEKQYSHNGGSKSSSKGSSGTDVGVHVYFTDNHRTVIRDYYRQEYRSGKCPPGLAKKNNGCMPPGQAKKWRIGHPLPHDVVVYDLPTVILRQIGPPPAGHRYVRVASDILMIAVGTGLIVDAIDDLNSM